MGLLLTSFLAGILTVISPCILPLLPIIIGGSLTEDKKSRAIIITLSLGLSIIVFTILLKTSFSFFTIPTIDIPFINTSVALTQIISGFIILVFGIFTFFPNLYEKISYKLHFSNSSQNFLNLATEKKGILGSILIGAALGPVFSSCSPTYAVILATVIPAGFIAGIIDLLFYVLGIAFLIILISIFGQKIVAKLKWAANPNGKFRKTLGLIFIIVSIIIILGLDKPIQTFISDHGYVDGTQLEKYLSNNTDSNKMFNVQTPYLAPDFTDISSWINSSPLKISDLKGKVVVVDVWTYSCINCIRTLPYITQWYDKYKPDGLVVVGLHAPEFNFEKDKSNVEKAVKQYNINYPVALDNNKTTWTAYKNTAWPTSYFIDKNGYVRHVHVGEGDYSQNEDIIRALLKENGDTNIDNIKKTTDSNTVPVSQIQSLETYFGYARNIQDRKSNFLNYSEQMDDVSSKYHLQQTLLSNQWSIGGDWTINEDEVISNSDDNILRFNLSAKDAYLVMGASTSSNIQVRLNDKVVDNLRGDDVDSTGNLQVKDNKLYKVIHSNTFIQNETLELIVPKGVSINTITFGS